MISGIKGFFNRKQTSRNNAPKERQTNPNNSAKNIIPEQPKIQIVENSYRQYFVKPEELHLYEKQKEMESRIREMEEETLRKEAFSNKYAVTSDLSNDSEKLITSTNAILSTLDTDKTIIDEIKSNKTEILNKINFVKENGKKTKGIIEGYSYWLPENNISVHELGNKLILDNHNSDMRVTYENGKLINVAIGGKSFRIKEDKIEMVELSNTPGGRLFLSFNQDEKPKYSIYENWWYTMSSGQLRSREIIDFTGTSRGITGNKVKFQNLTGTLYSNIQTSQLREYGIFNDINPISITGSNSYQKKHLNKPF